MSQNAQQLSLTAIAELPAIAPLPEQEISTEVLVEKYAKGAETNVHDVRRRVAKALAANEEEKQRAKWEERFLWAQENGFVPAGRINSAAGTPLAATLINCFVQPVGDSIVELVDGRPGIYSALAEADIFIAIGTSGHVYPAAGFVHEARLHGAHTVELNLEPSQVGSEFAEKHYGLASEVVPAFIDKLLQENAQ